MKKSKKLDDRTVKFVLKRPTSFFDEILSDIVYIIPVGYNPKKPVSTGPWKFVSFKPGQQTELVPFANYWGHKPAVDKLVLVELPDDSARVNALLSGQVDAINQVPFAQVPVLKSNGNLQTIVSQTAGWNPITMRVDTAPFNDVRVRQAIRLSHGSQAGGRRQRSSARASPASDYYGRYDPSCGHEPPAQAGHRPGQVAAESRRQAEPQGRARHVADLRGHRRGLSGAGRERQGGRHRISLRKVDVSTYFGGYGKWPFAVDYWVGLPYLVTASLNDGPGANVVNTTHFNDPEFNKLFNEAAKTIDSAKRTPIIQRCRRSSSTAAAT